jgi:hypothetical protein
MNQIAMATIATTIRGGRGSPSETDDEPRTAAGVYDSRETKRVAGARRLWFWHTSAHFRDLSRWLAGIDHAMTT